MKITYDKDKITVTTRMTTMLLEAIPPQIHTFDAYLYVVVPRKPEFDDPDHKFGQGVRIDPCVLDWETSTITCIIPFNINYGISSISDLDDDWFEMVQAAFLAQMHACLP